MFQFSFSSEIVVAQYIQKNNSFLSLTINNEPIMQNLYVILQLSEALSGDVCFIFPYQISIVKKFQKQQPQDIEESSETESRNDKSESAKSDTSEQGATSQETSKKGKNRYTLI